MTDYPQETDFAARVRRYSARFGATTSHQVWADPDSAERVVWADSATTFELVRDPRRSVSTVYSRLSDRRPCRSIRA